MPSSSPASLKHLAGLLGSCISYMRFTCHELESSTRLTWPTNSGAGIVGAFRPRAGQRASRRRSRLSSTAPMAPSWPESGEPASAHIHRGLALIRRELWSSCKHLGLTRPTMREAFMPRKGVTSWFWLGICRWVLFSLFRGHKRGPRTKSRRRSKKCIMSCHVIDKYRQVRAICRHVGGSSASRYYYLLFLEDSPAAVYGYCQLQPRLRSTRWYTKSYGNTTSHVSRQRHCSWALPCHLTLIPCTEQRPPSPDSRALTRA
ncbi:hypothetical protein V8C34DRAFT_50118 [Trichoderma compactum]